MPATRRSTRLLATPSGAPSPAASGQQLLTPEQDADLAATSPALPALNRLAFKATRRSTSVKPKLSLPPTPKSPSTVLPFAPAPAVVATMPVAGLPSSPANGAATSATVIPPMLPFSFADARQHLISADPRFATLFAAHIVKPYEQPEPVDVWRSLVSSLLGQQISWLAARSIQHRFVRLFFPTLLPEKHDPTEAPAYAHLFPTPAQVLALEGDRIAILKQQGLSTRKAEYIVGLSEAFADGTLSAARLTAATDDEVADLLLAIRGIGPWTVNMFSMFSLHRPNILPCGDLGVQKGLLKWTLQAHDPQTPLSLVPPPAPTTPHSLPAAVNALGGGGAPNYPPAFGLATPGSPSTSVSHLPSHLASSAPTASTSMSPPALLTAPLPAYAPHPLPDGLSLELLKARLAGKKTKAGAYLSPPEMEALTARWAPYRSVGVWLMWKVCGEE